MHSQSIVHASKSTPLAGMIFFANSPQSIGNYEQHIKAIFFIQSEEVDHD